MSWNTGLSHQHSSMPLASASHLPAVPKEEKWLRSLDFVSFPQLLTTSILTDEYFNWNLYEKAPYLSSCSSPLLKSRYSLVLLHEYERSGYVIFLWEAPQHSLCQCSNLRSTRRSGRVPKMPSCPQHRETTLSFMAFQMCPRRQPPVCSLQALSPQAAWRLSSTQWEKQRSWRDWAAELTYSSRYILRKNHWCQ